MTQWGFAALTLGCLGFVYHLLDRGAQALPAADRRLLLRNYILTIAGWLVFISSLALSGILSDFTGMPPRLVLVIVPPLVGLFFALRSRLLRAALDNLAPQWLLYPQAFRVAVEVLLWWLFLGGLLPEQMTFEGRNWDVLSGLTAPLAAWWCFAGGRQRYVAGLVWNGFGLVLLINIVTMAILSMPTPFRVFMNEPANTIVAMFPFVFLPAVLVPLAYYLHVFSIRQLWRLAFGAPVKSASIAGPA